MLVETWQCLQGYTGESKEGNLRMHEKLATAAETIFTFDELAFRQVLFSKLLSLCASSEVEGDSCPSKMFMLLS